MKTKALILKEARSAGEITTAFLVQKLGISRQAVARHLQELVTEGLLLKAGSTRNSRYLPNNGSKRKMKFTKLELHKKLAHLQEDKVFDEISLKLRLKEMLKKNVNSILYYAFTEMLNNAIDHSKSKNVVASFEISSMHINFSIIDKGIGIFENVKKKFKLQDEFEALQHILKGKQTTSPERHSGQGIFFTSRIADTFTIRSHKIKIIFDNNKEDYFVGEEKYLAGTAVTFQISKGSKKDLKEKFDQYTNDDFEFDRTDYKIKLIADREYLSRSQAKRILAGMDKYKKIVLDFSKVKFIGQAFAHEIFVVYQRQNPKIEMTFANANPTVTSMILREIKG